LTSRHRAWNITRTQPLAGVLDAEHIERGQFEEASPKYAEANGLRRDPDWFVLKIHEEVGELTQIWNKLSGRGRRHGRSEDELRRALADETADLFGHVLLFATQNGLDLASAVEENGISDLTTGETDRSALGGSKLSPRFREASQIQRTPTERFPA
jgi:NTP pyrophosphatase (non-canonical NTP hydrolase)